MKTNNTESKSRVVLTGGIVVVTLALATAAIVSMMPVQKAAAFDGAGEHCISSPKGDVACSGSGGSNSRHLDSSQAIAFSNRGYSINKTPRGSDIATSNGGFSGADGNCAISNGGQAHTCSGK